MVLAQTDIWLFPPNTVLAWFGFLTFVIVTVAASIKAIRYLVHSAIEANRWGFTRYKERRRIEAVLADITSNGGWPNGSTTLKESHQALYNKVTGVELSVQELTRTVEEVLLPMVMKSKDQQ